LNALFITGPTAVGKTGIALQVAERCNGEIIGADAFQIYQGLDVLTAKPSPEDLQRVRHHMVGVMPSAQSFDVAQYLEAATRCADEIASRGKLPIFAGGTGLYIRALTHGLSDLPKADAAIRSELDAATLEDLQKRYTALDPEGAKTIDLKNKRRLVRAIEVCLLAGKPFSAFRGEWKIAPESITGFFLTRDRDDLHECIGRRVEWMFRNGVVEEVRGMTDAGATASQAIGFKEIQLYLSGTISESDCIEQIKLATRQYAKRQITWFKRETLFETLNLSPYADLESAVQIIARKAGMIS
jgi:tRNA dimethylallyltransferase